MRTALAVALFALPVAASDPVPPAWTVLVYGAADNNADGPIQEFLDGLRNALDDDLGVELVLFLDRSAEHSDEAQLTGEDFTGGRLFRLRRDTAERLDGGEHFPQLAGDDPEVDSADPRTLAAFLAFGKARFPARRTALLIYSHANGETMCPDEESGRDMGIAELSDVLPASASVDFLALELCNMAGLEIAYQWRPREGVFGADVLLAIPNAGPPLDWARAFARLRSPGHAPAVVPGEERAGAPVDPATMDAAAFGTLIVEEGERGRRLSLAAGGRGLHESAGAFDLRRVGAVKSAFDALSVELARGGERETFLEMRGPGPIGSALNYSEGGPYVDAYDLCRRIALCDVFDEATRAAAERAMDAVDACVLASFGMDGLEGFEPGKHGLFVVAPRADGPGQREVWRNFAWYTPKPGPGRGVHGRWAFLGDGAIEGNGLVETWFELLDLWYDDTSADPGGFNGYRP
ncbi:MAG TPA: clostripain-related cysteine peptidase [Planctomycetota bacterium]|nr:clostripain-related cysteine peptidase [Planctomycetota bacterium]